MKLIKSDRRSLMKEAQLSNSLMIKLEGPGIKDFDPDKANDIGFQKCFRRPGTSSSQENKADAVQTAGSRCSTETSGGHEVNFEVNVQNDEAQQMPVEMYELVPVAEDSDYMSDYNSDDKNANEIFDIIAKY